MAEFVCSKCGYTKDTRCKPKVCPECDAAGSFDKMAEAKPASSVPAKKAPANVPAKKVPAKVPAKKPAAKKPAKK